MLSLLSCALHNSVLTLEAIYSRGESSLHAFFKELIDSQQSACCSHKKLRSSYEVKLFSVALTNIVFTACDNQQLRIIPRAHLLRQVVLALTRQQRTEQKQLLKAAKAGQKSKKEKKGGKEARVRRDMITQMVDNILGEGQEVGISSGEDGDLSGDEVKTPIFVIKRPDEEEFKSGMTDD